MRLTSNSEQELLHTSHYPHTRVTHSLKPALEMSMGLRLLTLKTLSERSQPCVTHPVGLKWASMPDSSHSSPGPVVSLNAGLSLCPIAPRRCQVWQIFSECWSIVYIVPRLSSNTNQDKI